MVSQQPQTDLDKEQSETSEKQPKKFLKNLRIGNASLIALVGLSIVGSLLVIPRPTYPQVLPLPEIDHARAQKREAKEVKRATKVLQGTLSKEARIVGEQFRRLGLVLSDSPRVENKALRSLHLDAAQLAAKAPAEGAPAGVESLLDLRALQAELFLDAVHAWLKSRKVDNELRELGGPFHRVARNSWLDEDGKLALNDNELRLLFRIHWGKVTGLYGKKPFGPTLEELRRYYNTNLQHPHGPGGDTRSKLLGQMGFAKALGDLDPDYPGLLAQGIIQLRMGESIAAANSLKAHLDQHPSGEWSQLARNHHLLAVRQANALSASGL